MIFSEYEYFSGISKNQFLTYYILLFISSSLITKATLYNKKELTTKQFLKIVLLFSILMDYLFYCDLIFEDHYIGDGI